jgi:serine/threonine protein kinase
VYIPASLSQCGSRCDRSPVVAPVLTLDIDKAFDSLDRPILIAIPITNNLCNEDELRMIKFLFSDTTLRALMEGQLGPKFSTQIGTLKYMSPEMRTVKAYSYNTDVW